MTSPLSHYTTTTTTTTTNTSPSLTTTTHDVDHDNPTIKTPVNPIDASRIKADIQNPDEHVGRDHITAQNNSPLLSPNPPKSAKAVKTAVELQKKDYPEKTTEKTEKKQKSNITLLNLSNLNKVKQEEKSEEEVELEEDNVKSGDSDSYSEIEQKRNATPSNPNVPPLGRVKELIKDEHRADAPNASREGSYHDKVGKEDFEKKFKKIENSFISYLEGNKQEISALINAKINMCGLKSNPKAIIGIIEKTKNALACAKNLADLNDICHKISELSQAIKEDVMTLSNYVNKQLMRTCVNLHVSDSDLQSHLSDKAKDNGNNNQKLIDFLKSSTTALYSLQKEVKTCGKYFEKQTKETFVNSEAESSIKLVSKDVSESLGRIILLNRFDMQAMICIAQKEYLEAREKIPKDNKGNLDMGKAIKDNPNEYKDYVKKMIVFLEANNNHILQYVKELCKVKDELQNKTISQAKKTQETLLSNQGYMHFLGYEPHLPNIEEIDNLGMDKVIELEKSGSTRCENFV